LKGPGIFYLIPVIDRAPLKISTRLDTIQFRTESTLTKDNVPVNVDSVLYMKPVDLEKAVLQVENYYQATQLAAQTTLREVIGKVTLNDLLAEREKVGSTLREIIDEKTEAWGIKVTSVEVRDVIIPGSLQDAMSRQAQAERERIARVTLATAEFEASQKMIEAAKNYEQSPDGLRLRWMNILYELGQQSGSNTIMLVPANMPEAGVSAIGTLGLKQIQNPEAGPPVKKTKPTEQT
jgi:regulator of protease activity HflC (stomatin/prohibitin superfamily)